MRIDRIGIYFSISKRYQLMSDFDGVLIKDSSNIVDEHDSDGGKNGRIFYLISF